MDIQLTWNPNESVADLALSGADLATDEGLRTAIIVSLFSDRRAEPEDGLPAGSDGRGWWGDAFAPVPGDRNGSRLWLLAREKTEASAVERAREYTGEALAWLVEDGVADRVGVSAERQGDRLALGVDVWRPRRPPVRYRFEAFWQGA